MKYENLISSLAILSPPADQLGPSPPPPPPEWKSLENLLSGTFDSTINLNQKYLSD